MKLPRLRLTVRRLMILVAVLGLALGLWGWMERRRAAFLERSRDYSYGEWVEAHQRRRPEVREHYSRLALKYGQAARSPWWPVAPDPPEPE